MSRLICVFEELDSFAAMFGKCIPAVSPVLCGHCTIPARVSEDRPNEHTQVIVNLSQRVIALA